MRGYSPGKLVGFGLGEVSGVHQIARWFIGV
jgi:hypothetical protein